MGAQQSAVADISVMEKKASVVLDAVEENDDDDAHTLRAHAIDCCSIASSYQSLSDLDDFLKPGETSLNRWSVPSLPGPSDILTNPIYEGDELHPLDEEEDADHEVDAAAGSKRAGAAAPGEQLSAAEKATGGNAVEGEEATQGAKAPIPTATAESEPPGSARTFPAPSPSAEPMSTAAVAAATAALSAPEVTLPPADPAAVAIAHGDSLMEVEVLGTQPAPSSKAHAPTAARTASRLHAASLGLAAVPAPEVTKVVAAAVAAVIAANAPAMEAPANAPSPDIEAAIPAVVATAPPATPTTEADPGASEKLPSTTEEALATDESPTIEEALATANEDPAAGAASAPVVEPTPEKPADSVKSQELFYDQRSAAGADPAALAAIAAAAAADVTAASSDCDIAVQAPPFDGSGPKELPSEKPNPVTTGAEAGVMGKEPSGAPAPAEAVSPAAALKPVVLVVETQDAEQSVQTAGKPTPEQVVPPIAEAPLATSGGPLPSADVAGTMAKAEPALQPVEPTAPMAVEAPAAATGESGGDAAAGAAPAAAGLPAALEAVKVAVPSEENGNEESSMPAVETDAALATVEAANSSETSQPAAVPEVVAPASHDHAEITAASLVADPCMLAQLEKVAADSAVVPGVIVPEGKGEIAKDGEEAVAEDRPLPAAAEEEPTAAAAAEAEEVKGTSAVGMTTAAAVQAAGDLTQVSLAPGGVEAAPEVATRRDALAAAVPPATSDDNTHVHADGNAEAEAEASISSDIIAMPTPPPAAMVAADKLRSHRVMDVELDVSDEYDDEGCATPLGKAGVVRSSTEQGATAETNLYEPGWGSPSVAAPAAGSATQAPAADGNDDQRVLVGTTDAAAAAAAVQGVMAQAGDATEAAVTTAVAAAGLAASSDGVVTDTGDAHVSQGDDIKVVDREAAEADGTAVAYDKLTAGDARGKVTVDAPNGVAKGQEGKESRGKGSRLKGGFFSCFSCYSVN